jgi:hypothetical protein
VLAAAAIVVVVAGGAMLSLRPGSGPRPEALSSASPVAPARDRETPRAPAQAQVIALPRKVDPRAPVSISVPAGTPSLRLDVPVPGAPSYSAAIRSAKGVVVWRATDLDPPDPGHPLALTVPAEALLSGAYELTVEGEAMRGQGARSAVLRYSLRVSREP